MQKQQERDQRKLTRAARGKEMETQKLLQAIKVCTLSPYLLYEGKDCGCHSHGGGGGGGTEVCVV